MLYTVAVVLIILWLLGLVTSYTPVSYTHLDVYKRQVEDITERK